jgi:hypothetical protein
MIALRIAVLLVLAAAASIGATGDHEMLAAQQELKLAKDHLRDAGTDYEGHRRNAMEHIDRALQEIRLGLEVSKGRREGGGTPRGGRAKPAPSDVDDD